MDDKALAVTEIRPICEGFYDYDAKYSHDTKVAAVHVLPAEVPPAIYEQAMAASLAAHQALGCRGVSRSDFRYDDTRGAPGRLYYLETNTQPGRSEEHTSELQSLMRISYAVFCLKQKKSNIAQTHNYQSEI